MFNLKLFVVGSLGRGGISEAASLNLRSFPFRKELGRPRMVVPTGVVVCGRADGPHRQIERFRPERFSH